MRTQTSGTQTKWTIATWFKSSPDRLGLSERHLFGAQRSSSSCCNDETHLGVAYSTTRQMTTTFHDTSDQQQQYRAASVSLSDDTYHHVAWTFDSTASPTVSRVWLDGNEVTSFGSSASIPHNSVGSVGRSGRPFAWADNGVGQTSTFPFDGRLCDSIYLDGVAIDDPVSGGLLTPSGGPADPQELAYGPNGSWQDYSDSSNLGRDASPNGNDFETHGGGYVGQRAF